MDLLQRPGDPTAAPVGSPYLARRPATPGFRTAADTYDRQMLTGVLLDALLECLTFLELSDDDVVDPNEAASVQDRVAGLFGTLGPGEREMLIGLVKARAARETGVVREWLNELPESLGLLDED
ncbi:hypothetical protein [Micromonospora cathayae]|uniref:Tellurite resistance protein TerB n=1 Tax=Micromonospora cathayae TaxID=3028804 RepID=A0ABY7ZNB4_9ACTN|nr:hypothetical protein [Micromonospora sp. HUAS 3]WDZ84517.1 hypothetical protein PVK37_29460 [Micromonospora sp. HUAS 3]